MRERQRTGTTENSGVPFDGPALLDHLRTEACPRAEDVDATAYRRSLRMPRSVATVELRPAADHVDATLQLDDMRDLTAVIHRCRRLFDLDADPLAVPDVLLADENLAPLVAKRPGLRVPGHADNHELAVRAVLRQQLDHDEERHVTSVLVERHGTPLTSPHGRITHTFPDATTLAPPKPARMGAVGRRRTHVHEDASLGHV